MTIEELKKSRGYMDKEHKATGPNPYGHPYSIEQTFTVMKNPTILLRRSVEVRVDGSKTVRIWEATDTWKKATSEQQEVALKRMWILLNGEVAEDLTTDPFYPGEGFYDSDDDDEIDAKAHMHIRTCGVRSGKECTC